MDMKTFAENDFDPKKWINRAWNTSESQEKKVFMANTIGRLRLYMKELSYALEDTTTQITSSVPGMLQEASTLQAEGSMLQQKLLALERQVQGVQQQTGHSIESLQRIDQLKSRLENAACALREADKWAALAAALEDTLDTGVPTQPDKLDELADQVAAMTASLEVLVDAPDYDRKRVQLETLYNRLEAAISPPLLDALTQMDAERTRRYVRVARAMSRGAWPARCWRGAAAARAAPAWRRLPAHSLRALAQLLHARLRDQMDWLTNVLKSETPVVELFRLYTDLLLSLDPSPTKVVTAKFKLVQSPEEGLHLLADVRSDTDELVRGLRQLMDTHPESVPSSVVQEFGRAAYAPLRALLPRCAELQAQLFLAHLDGPQLQQEGLLEYSRGVVSVAERCEAWLGTARATAEQIAGPAAYHFYAPAVEALVAALVSLMTAHTRRLESEFVSSMSRGRCAGVLGEAFPATLALHHAAELLRDALAAQAGAGAGAGARGEAKHPLEDLESFLLESESQRYQRAEDSWCSSVRAVGEQLRPLARQLLAGPVHLHLDKIPQLAVWHNNDALSTDLPDFALSPQEYITEIGQYLMTLPQHLEMHLSEKQAPWQFLNEVCTHTSDAYAEKILNIRNMDALGTKRCLTDIVYLSSVIEDLGSSITPSLKNLEKSLRAATPGHNE